MMKFIETKKFNKKATVPYNTNLTQDKQTQWKYLQN